LFAVSVLLASMDSRPDNGGSGSLPVWQSIANFDKIRTIIGGTQEGVALDSADAVC